MRIFKILKCYFYGHKPNFEGSYVIGADSTIFFMTECVDCKKMLIIKFNNNDEGEK